MFVAKLTLEQGRFRLDRLTRALSWLLPATTMLLVIDIAVVETGLSMALAAAFALLLIVGFPVCVVLVSMWFHRANANLHATGLAMNHGPHMAWIWFLVPVANLFKPYQVLREIWVDSHRLADGFAAPSPSLLGLWWGSWIAGIGLFRVADLLAVAYGAPRASLAVSVLAALALVASALSLRTLIREVNTAQQGQADADVFS